MAAIDARHAVSSCASRPHGTGPESSLHAHKEHASRPWRVKICIVQLSSCIGLYITARNAIIQFQYPSGAHVTQEGQIEKRSVTVPNPPTPIAHYPTPTHLAPLGYVLVPAPAPAAALTLSYAYSAQQEAPTRSPPHTTNPSPTPASPLPRAPACPTPTPIFPPAGSPPPGRAAP